MVLLLAEAAVPEDVGGIPTKQLMYMIGGGALVLAVILLVFKLLFGSKKKKPKSSDGKLRERLSDYPPPPRVRTARRLTVNGLPARVRLVVIAPAGHGTSVNVEMIPRLMEKVTPGIGEILEADRPRMKVWPTQVSVKGFTPTFQRLVVPPEDGDDAERWVLLCGPAKVGPKTILVGMALLSDEPSYLEPIAMDPEDWRRMLRLEKV